MQMRKGYLQLVLKVKGCLYKVPGQTNQNYAVLEHVHTY